LKALTAAALLLATVSCSLWRAAPIPYGQEVTAVRRLDPLQQRLEAADAASVNLLLTDIGRIEYPGFASVFWRMVYRPFAPGLKRVLIVAGVRGNEAAGVECTLDIIDQLRAAPGPGRLFNADILPVVNPWGWTHGLGRNREKLDIGQDFSAFRSREARIVRRFLRGKRYDLVVDLSEEADARGFSIRTYAPETLTAAERVVAEIRARGYPIEPRAGDPWRSPQEGILTAGRWHLALKDRLGALSLPEYARRQFSPAVYTVVTPALLPLADRVAMQRAAVDALLAAHAAPTEPPAAGAPPTAREAP
jgi:hypothetical protein